MASSKITTKDLSEPVVDALNTIDTVADQITVVDGNVSSIKSTVEGNSNKLDTIQNNLSVLSNQSTIPFVKNINIVSPKTSTYTANTSNSLLFSASGPVKIRLSNSELSGYIGGSTLAAGVIYWIMVIDGVTSTFWDGTRSASNAQIPDGLEIEVESTFELRYKCTYSSAFSCNVTCLAIQYK